MTDGEQPVAAIAGLDPDSSRHQQLLDVATTLFSEHGYESTTVRMIADRLGILSGSLYSHVASKEEILKQIAFRVGRDFLEAATVVRQNAKDPVEALRTLCRAHLRIVHEQQTAVVVYYNEWRKLDRGAQNELVAMRESYQAVFLDVFADGVRAGAFEASDQRRGVLVMLSTLNWTSQWYRPDGDLSHQQIADWCVDILLRGLLKRS